MAFQVGQYEFILAAGPFHSKIQIGPVKTGDQALGILQLQAIQDVLLDLLGGRGGEGSHHRPPGQEFQKVQDPGIAGTEILPPLGDAVGFIHCHQRDFRFLGETPEQLRLQSFRSHIK